MPMMIIDDATAAGVFTQRISECGKTIFFIDLTSSLFDCKGAACVGLPYQNHNFFLVSHDDNQYEK